MDCSSAPLSNCLKVLHAGLLANIASLALLLPIAGHTQPARDLVSDSVGATVGVFRVDESGQTTYSIGIAVPPGTAGVTPTLSLDYSSQGSTGVMGKGWSIGGQSSIGRCRKSREAGDFYWLGGELYDGNPLPIGLNNNDVFCLDGQRLLLVSGTYGANNAVYKPELDPWTRVTSKNGNNSTDPATYTGPQYFTVERKDGSISEYGNSADSRVERNQCGGSTGIACAVSAWALNRFEDSTGNYITYHYKKFLDGTETTSGLGSDEYVLSEVRYTGKRVLSGQTGTASNPYARVLFDYTADTPYQQKGWLAGAQVAQTRRLDSIKVQDPYASTPRTVRYYGLTYGASGSNSNQRRLISVQECNKGPGDTGVDAAQVCYPATTFTESSAKYQFNVQANGDVAFDVSDRKNVRLGDVDGDGRLDLIWARNTGESTCKSRIFVSYGDRLLEAGASKLTLATPSQQGICLPYVLPDYDDSWQVFDYDGDGRDDLMVPNAPGSTGRWSIYGARTSRPASSSTPAFVVDTDLLGSILIPDALLSIQLLDMNGDGLVDILYPVQVTTNPSSYELLGRLRERYEVSPGVFALRFGAETPTAFNFSPDDPCSPTYSGSPKPDICFLTLSIFGVPTLSNAIDLDGDGRADGLVDVTRMYSDGATGEIETQVRYLPPGRLEATLGEISSQGRAIATERYGYFFASRPARSLFGSTLAFESFGNPIRMYDNSVGEMPTGIGHIRMADFNGDSLTDLLYRDPSISSGETWRLRLNTGKGFSTTAAVIANVTNPDLAQIADINGDGRADLLYPPSSNTCVSGGSTNTLRPFCVRYGQAGGISLSAAVHVPGGGAQTTSTPWEYEHYFADFDGDGATDYVRFNRENTASGELFTSRSSTRHQARDVIVKITDGIGAVTNISYQPLTNASVYRRDTGSLTGDAAFGRGSPVFDLLGPLYVVSSVSSSAPIYTDAAALATVSYRYTGAKMQSGGRGFLGFRQIVSYDGNNDLNTPSHLVTRTEYRQDFPFVGSPELTEKFAVASAISYGSPAIDACRNDPEITSQACFYSVGATWPAQTGTLISRSEDVWACQGTGNGTTCPIASNPLRLECIELSNELSEFNPLGTQQPLFAYLTGTLTSSYAYNSTTSGNGAWLSTTMTGLCYEDGHGNLTYSSTANLGDSGPLSLKTTLNTYSNDTTKWRLGRLTESTVKASNTCEESTDPDEVMVCTDWTTRKSRFAYDMASTAKTGLLNQEAIQPGGGADQELRTLYTYDQYGNATYEYKCSAYEADGSTLTDAECRTASQVKHHPAGATGSITAVHRYARTVYDAIGRYPTSTRLPFYSAGGTNNVSEQASLTIGARDEFGNATQQTDANGKIGTLRYGALGRPYYAGDNTGAATTTTYRWCSSVSCPVDAAYRSQTVSATSGAQSGAPTQWVYYDRLGRPVLTVAQAFLAGVTGQDFSATCAYYDNKSRPARASEPFFLTTAAIGGAPDFLGGTYDPCVSVSWTRTEYDLLGRTTRTILPDNSESSFSYSGLTTITTNAKSQKIREIRNALGQVIQTTQANPTTPSTLGMSVDMAYDAFGNLLSVSRNADHGLIVTTHEYDALGRRTRTIDPDRGTERAYYNAAGEVIRTIDGAGMEVGLDIDALGRVWRRKSGTHSSTTQPIADRIFGNGFEEETLPTPGVTTDLWVFDTATNGRGLLHYEERTTEAQPSFRRTMAYDTKGRPLDRYTLLDASTYTETWEYDSLGRVYREGDASGGRVERIFTNRGYPEKLRNADSPSEVYQQFTAQNARGQITNEIRGAATLTRTYDAQRGWLTGLTASASGTLQNLAYGHDLLGNTQYRQDYRANQREDFSYDGLNRLKTATVTFGANPGVTTLNLTYDALGNICSKNGQTYSYDGVDGCNATGLNTAASPHAVTQIGTTAYRYDSNGTLAHSAQVGNPAGERWFAYDGLQQLNLVLVGSLFGPSAELELRYGPSGDRYLRKEQTSAGTTITRYIGNVEQITRPNGVTETKRTLGGILIQTSFSNGAATTRRYLYHDALGSIDVITNEAGTVQERLSFDGHGSRRNAADWRTLLASYTPQTTTDGFTGHEHLDPFGLIHMNGRVYDPAMGRFIQADPFTDAGIQGLNRYSYVLNNPLTLTDPSGYSSWNKWLRVAAAIVIAYYTGDYAATLYAANNIAGAFAVVAAGGFAAGAIQTGTVKGGLYGAFGAVAFFGVGTAFSQANAGWAYSGGELNSIGLVAKTVAHGIVGGIMSDLQGGKFGHGFVSAGATQAVSPQIGNIPNAAGRVVAAAALGGSVSALTGGKFANGAVTAAFSYAFNEGAHGAFKASVRARAIEARKILDAESTNLRGKYFLTESDAHAAFAKAFEPHSTRLNLEFGANILQEVTGDGLRYVLDDFVISNKFDPSSGQGWNAPIAGRPNDSAYVAYTHTHPSGGGGLSYPDYEVAITRKINAYVVQSGGASDSFIYQKYLNAGSPGVLSAYTNGVLYRE